MANSKYIRTEETARGSWTLGSTKKRQGHATESRKMTSYMMRDLELKSEEKLRNQRKSDNWKRRQELKLKDDTEAIHVSILLRKKAPKEPKKKMKIANTQGKTSQKSNKDQVGKTDMPAVRDCLVFCLEKRQHTSSAVTFARLKSNRRYKPGD